jgi:dihydrofolate reductase
MKRVRYSVAMSIDGFIAGPRGEHDWIVMDPGFDWDGLHGQFDTMVMGRSSYNAMRERGMSPKAMGMSAFVVSTTLVPADHPDVTIVSRHVPQVIAALKAGSGPEPEKDIWLSGGGVLFRCLLDAGLVDAVDLAVVPVLLGSGVPVIPEGKRSSLKLAECKTGSTGIVMLKYDVV